MKIKPKGRKIYKTKEKNYYGKSPMGKFLSGALTVLLIGGIGFLGYSVAEPVINYTKHKGDEPEEPEISATEPMTENATALGESPTEAQTTEKTEPVEEMIYKAAMLKPSDLASIEALKSALEEIPQDEGIEYVEIPLKYSGGSIYYASIVAEAQTAVKSNILLADIVKETEKSGFKPSAFLSIFNDNIVPLAYPETGYVMSEDSTQWTDSNEKPWMSPYSQRALDYNTNIVLEVTSEGFEQIVCSDLIFPDFTNSDLQILDPVLGETERCMALTSSANVLYDRAVANGASMQIEVSAVDILLSKADILQPMLLSSNNIIINIDLDRLSDGVAEQEFNGTPAENVEKCLSLVNDILIDFNTTVRVSGNSFTTEELLEAKEAINQYGYKAFVIG